MNALADETGTVYNTRSYRLLPDTPCGESAKRLLTSLAESAETEVPGVWAAANSDVQHDGLAAKSVSTYPLVRDKTNGKLKRDGEPNADSFFASATPHGALLCIADGCNWGVRPCRAARNALLGAREYLFQHAGDITTIRLAGHYLFRALCNAQKTILAGAPTPREAGTSTTLLAMVLRTDAGEWALLVASVGDCKCFCWRSKHRRFIDVTRGTRCFDMRDPGGRLGPYAKGAFPDLRNLTLFHTTLDPDDFIMLTSDGVYDNFDPQFHGTLPRELGLDFDAWNKMPNEQAASLKEQETVSSMTRMFPDAIDSATQVVQRLLYHVVSLTAKARKFMEENPGKKQPTNYAEFPGKMDHSTCVVYKVACDPSLPDKKVARPSAFAKRNADK